VGNSVNSLTEVQVDNSHSLSLMHWGGHLVIAGDQVGQAGEEGRLADRHPYPLIITKMQLNGAQDPLHRKMVHDLHAHLQSCFTELLTRAQK